ncbi:MAG: HAMP domain-containing histidine kinase [Flavobacteriaceae bacterium]|nr:HAMP domain-containing histidine kinase [Flavobacteriaceae bacterium]
MKYSKFSLRTRIFIAMIFLVIIASVLIAFITIYQYNEQAEDYHNKRLERKEEAIKSAISYELNRDTIYSLETKYLPRILDKKLNEISDIHNLDINIYDLNGKLLRSSHARYINDTTNTNLSNYILNEINNNPDHRLVLANDPTEDKNFKSSYTFINDSKFKPVGIIGIPYLQDNTFQDEELKEFLIRLSLVYLLILLIAVGIAYFLSKYITKSLESVSNKMRQTTLDKTNEKIILEDASQEITNLVNSYNNMIDQIEDSAVKLAQIERKQAWREMAKQVAHEIKNPLTPMRLTVQSFEHNFDPTDPEIKQKLHEYSESLIQQIDTLSSIASAFSNFAQMPNQKKEEVNVVEEVKKDLNIFQESYIFFYPEKDIIKAKLDKIQLSRVVTNLITNAIHALNNNENPKIDVHVLENKNEVIIEVKDNGQGITEEDASKVFEPKFTTKSSGMGLGLPMVKNIVEAYNGSISFKSKVNMGTIFTVTLPKE